MANPNYATVTTYDVRSGTARMVFGCRLPGVPDGGPAYWLPLTRDLAEDMAERWNAVEAIRRGDILTITPAVRT